MKQFALLGFLLIFGLAACSAPATQAPPGGGMRMGMGMGGGMMERHSAPIPEEYAGLTNPIVVDEESFARGGVIFATNCATCHGDGGMGDGPTAAGLAPAPVPIAHTSQMMGDDYLFWRISEGGVPFSTAMPTWKGTLDDQARWDVINYVRALGKGQVQPGSGMGGAMFDPAVEAAQRAEMLAQAVEQGLITQEEAGTFNTVHAALDEYRAGQPFTSDGASPAERQAAMLAELVKSGALTQAQSASFVDIHQRIINAGLMQ